MVHNALPERVTTTKNYQRDKSCLYWHSLLEAAQSSLYGNSTTQKYPGNPVEDSFFRMQWPLDSTWFHTVHTGREM